MFNVLHFNLSAGVKFVRIIYYSSDWRKKSSTFEKVKEKRHIRRDWFIHYLLFHRNIAASRETFHSRAATNIFYERSLHSFKFRGILFSPCVVGRQVHCTLHTVDFPFFKFFSLILFSFSCVKIMRNASTNCFR